MAELNEYGARVTNVRMFDPERDVVYYQGQRLTNELALEISDRLDHEANPRMFPNLVPGGKSLSGDGVKRSPSIQVVLPERLHAQVVELAAGANMSVSRWARRELEHAVASSTREAAGAKRLAGLAK